jgi:hypothetical protein
MTPERRRALLMMGATFVIGIIIGALASGMFARQFYHGREKRGDKKEMREGRKGTFTDRIFKVVKPDSSQKKLMKPILDKTIATLDDIEDKSNTDAYAQLDSLKVRLRPILGSEQNEKLDKYLTARIKSHAEEEKREHDRDHGKGRGKDHDDHEDGDEH